MKYRVLITGRNRVIKKDVFTYLWSDFECLTCSNSYEDIKNHLKYITPDALICCLFEEDASGVQQISSMKKRLESEHIALVLVGSREDCGMYEINCPGIADLVIEKPISAGEISERLSRYINSRKRAEEQAAESPAEEVSEETRELLQEIKELEEQNSKKRKHILVVDDDPLMLKLMKEHLHEKYDVATAISGKVAMKFLATKITDLILLDYEMPGENGPQVLEQIKGNEATKDVPVVFLTSITDREKIQTALQLKPQGYLLKPIDQARLLQEIKKQLG